MLTNLPGVQSSEKTAVDGFFARSLAWKWKQSVRMWHGKRSRPAGSVATCDGRVLAETFFWAGDLKQTDTVDRRTWRGNWLHKTNDDHLRETPQTGSSLRSRVFFSQTNNTKASDGQFDHLIGHFFLNLCLGTALGTPLGRTDASSRRPHADGRIMTGCVPERRRADRASGRVD